MCPCCPPPDQGRSAAPLYDWPPWRMALGRERHQCADDIAVARHVELFLTEIMIDTPFFVLATCQFSPVTFTICACRPGGPAKPHQDLSFHRRQAPAQVVRGDTEKVAAVGKRKNPVLVVAREPRLGIEKKCSSFLCPVRKHTAGSRRCPAPTPPPATQAPHTVRARAGCRGIPLPQKRRVQTTGLPFRRCSKRCSAVPGRALVFL